eukprot:gnl/Spiro4/16787_TR9034_c0_g1_i1.p1 gnl/Spiro4/16787_TR9034_c0_g1~~gnl/Spiro4/16787_TR9034_c0_g1_i1.p1  ORF type:complete len:248 (+),score=23.54 gnl/Spiro4/16787_TR9034_c0_g1_i1:54-797(+)
MLAFRKAAAVPTACIPLRSGTLWSGPGSGYGGSMPTYPGAPFPHLEHNVFMRFDGVCERAMAALGIRPKPEWEITAFDRFLRFIGWGPRKLTPGEALFHANYEMQAETFEAYDILIENAKTPEDRKKFEEQALELRRFHVDVQERLDQVFSKVLNMTPYQQHEFVAEMTKWGRGPNDPIQADTYMSLEWVIPRPIPAHLFAEVPVVKEERVTDEDPIDLSTADTLPPGYHDGHGHGHGHGHGEKLHA